MDVNKFMKQLTNEELEEISGAPLALKELKESKGWQVLIRVFGLWIEVRREDMETLSMVSEEDRLRFTKMQGEIEILKVAINLPDMLLSEHKLDADEEEKEND